MRISVGLLLVKLISGALKGTKKEKTKAFELREKRDGKFLSDTLAYDDVPVTVNNPQSFVDSCLF